MRYLLLVFIFCSTPLWSQITKPVREIDGVEYYLHKVESGQTLYGIAKLYNVGMKEIQKANDLSSENIQLGQILKIRKGGSGMQNPSEIIVVPDRSNANLNVESGYHLVQPGETAYSICQRYKLKLYDFYILNPIAENGISVNQKVRISSKVPEVPIVDVEVPKSIDYAKQESVKVKNGKMKIYLLLPFFASVKDSVITQKQKVIRQTALEIYRGMMMSRSEMEKLGQDIEIEVIDFYNNVEQVGKWTSGDRLNDADLIIGPLFKESIEAFAPWVKKRGIWMVCPVPISNKILMGNERIVKAFPSDVSQWGASARYIIGKKSDAVPVFVYAGKSDTEKKRAEAFKSSYLKSGLKNLILSNNIDSLFTALSVQTDSMVVVIPSNSADLVKKFNAKSHLLKRTWLVGMADWVDYLSELNEEDGVKNNLNFSFTMASEKKSEKSKVSSWVGKYRKSYMTHPTEYSFCGYDILLAFTQQYANGKMDLLRHEMNINGLFCNIDLIQVGRGGGFENAGVVVMESNHGEVNRVK